MTQARKPALPDMVAVLGAGPDTPVEAGDVGTVVELLPPDPVEVEFLQRDGRTRYLAMLPVADVLGRVDIQCTDFGSRADPLYVARFMDGPLGEFMEDHQGATTRGFG